MGSPAWLGACALVIGDLPEGSDDARKDASAGAGGVDAGQDATDADGSVDSGGAAGASATGGSAGAAGTSGTGGSAGGGGTAGAAGSDAGCTCDCDGDKHYAVGAGCNGDDCDDHDPDVHPGQGGFFSTPSKTQGFDYDCSGGVERDDDVISCKGLAISGCGTQPDGYLALAPCGQTADWGGCKVTGIVPLQTCSDDVKQTARVVKCH